MSVFALLFTVFGSLLLFFSLLCAVVYLPFVTLLASSPSFIPLPLTSSYFLCTCPNFDFSSSFSNVLQTPIPASAIEKETQKKGEWVRGVCVCAFSPQVARGAFNVRERGIEGGRGGRSGGIKVTAWERGKISRGGGRLPRCTCCRLLQPPFFLALCLRGGQPSLFGNGGID